MREEGLTRGRAGRGTVAGERSGPVSNDGGNICAGGGAPEAVAQMAAKQFEEFAKTVGFAQMGRRR